MARHFSKEARLSRRHANRIILKAFIAILLYCFAINLLVGYGSLFVLGYLTQSGVNVRRILSIALIVVVAEVLIYILVKLLLLKSEKMFLAVLFECDVMFILSCVLIYLKLDRMLMILIVAGASFVFAFIVDLLKYVWKIYVRKPDYYIQTLRALRHNRRVENAKVRMLHGLWRSLKWGQIPAGKTREEVEREKEEVVRLLQEHRRKAREANHKVDSYKDFFVRNRYAKNQYTEIRYRRARSFLHRVENGFVVIASLFVFIFFSFLTIQSARMGDNDFLDLDPKANPVYFYFYITMGIVFLFHFICGALAGSVTRIKLWDHDNAFIDVNAPARMDGADMNIYPDYSARKMSLQRRFDDSSAILEEKPREYRMSMFFLRNLSHVIFALAVSVLFIYLTPVFVKFSMDESSPYALIFKILNFVMLDFVTGAMYYALSTREFEYDCMDERLMMWRYRQDVFLFFFIILAAGYLVLMLLVKEFNLLEPVVYSRALSCIIMITIFSITAFLVNLIMLPKERRKKNRDVMVFSSIESLSNMSDYSQYYDEETVN